MNSDNKQPKNTKQTSSSEGKDGLEGWRGDIRRGTGQSEWDATAEAIKRYLANEARNATVKIVEEQEEEFTR